MIDLPFHPTTYHMASTRSTFIGLLGAGTVMLGRDTIHDYSGGEQEVSDFSSGQDALWVGILVLVHKNLETLGLASARNALSILDKRLWVNIKSAIRAQHVIFIQR